jgi:hypothetical protein
MLARIDSLTASLILFIAGCGLEKNETAESSSDGTAAVSETDPATDSVSSTPGETDSTSIEPTGGGATDSGTDTTTTPELTTTTATASEPTSNATTTESETATDTAEPPPDPSAPCTAVCEHIVECELNPELESCVEGCVGEFGGDQACVDAFELHADCLVALDCQALGPALESPEQSDCNRSGLALDASCGGGGRECSIGGGGGPGQCEWQISCEGELEKTMKCDDFTCSCLVGDEQVGECAAEGICDTEFDGLEDKAKACCGF